MQLEDGLTIDMITFCLIAASVLIALYLWSQRRPKNFPPGPWGFPIVGHLPLLGLEPHLTAIAWKPKYGPIVGIDFASFPCIIISDYKLAKEAFANPIFTGRPKLPFLSWRSGGRPEGIVMTSGRTWKEQRTFTNRRLREIGGFGTRAMEVQIMAEVQDFVGELRVESDHGRRPLSMRHRYNLAMLSALWVIVGGERLSCRDEKVKHVLRVTLEAVGEHNFLTMLSMFMPWFANNFPFWLTRADGLQNFFLSAIGLVQPFIDEHYKTRVAGQPRDYIDAYIDEIEETTDPESSFHGSRSKHSISTAVTDLFLAGSDTSGATMEWISFLMATHPEMQARASAEIQAVIGNDRFPSLNDRKSLPYTEAMINEVMRFRPVISIGLFHAATEDVIFHGYNIPEGTMVFINMWEAHFNQEIWGKDANEFRPERWLSDDGKEFVRREGLLLFSSGKRNCPGEQLGRDELFLFTVGLMQAFRLEIDPNGPKPTLKPMIAGTNLVPSPHKLVLMPRN